MVLLKNKFSYLSQSVYLDLALTYNASDRIGTQEEHKGPKRSCCPIILMVLDVDSCAQDNHRNRQSHSILDY